ncbi:hypothetical protein ACXYTJ_15505 [Gilvimarinus sp. F26214L]|uniref:hypothetical protein n=1 Tax=Gilvimarinus sp. DZF01 TaxID=3461371 RepID=UPI004046698F
MRERESPSRSALIQKLLKQHGRTFAEELAIPVQKNTPSALFQLLVAALLFSARIPAHNALEATRALIEAGLTTPRKMAQASWQERVDVITWHGYKRYDESGSTRLGQTAQLLLERYQGDLRRLRDAADGDVGELKKRLMEFKGIGPVGADIFLREIQGVWTEVYPYGDARVLKTAAKLGVGRTVSELAELVPPKDFPRLAAALVRVDLEHTYDTLRSA